METREEMEKMTKDEIKEYAEEYGIELSTNDLKDEMIDQFLEERQEQETSWIGKKVQDSPWVAFGVTALVLILLFAATLLGPKLIGGDEVREYNNFPFKKQNNVWIVQAQKGDQPYQIQFHYPPWEVEDIISDPTAENTLISASRNNRENTTVFITMDPSLSSRAVIAGVEISKLTGSRFNILNLETHGALTEEPKRKRANTNNPIVTCENANENNIVILLKVTDNNIIHQEGDCIILEGKSAEDLIRVADKFAYKIMGVME